jgi:hypothetical protein
MHPKLPTLLEVGVAMAVLLKEYIVEDSSTVSVRKCTSMRSPVLVVTSTYLPKLLRPSGILLVTAL